jgi:hypothetical protein
MPAGAKGRRGIPFPGKSRLSPAAFQEGGSAIERHGGTPVDMRGVARWKTVLGVDTSEYSWGQVIVTGEARPSPLLSAFDASPNAISPENLPWIEVRIIADINDQRITLLEQAVGVRIDQGFYGSVELGARSCGPILLPLFPGEVPDRIEVHARARRGGLIETSFDVDEVLKIRASTRMHV